jgi:hypothetical protein
MTRPHTLAVNGAFESAQSAGGPLGIPREALHVYEEAQADRMETFTEIRDIVSMIERAAAERKLFSDLGVPWAKSTDAFALEDYTSFSI